MDIGNVVGAGFRLIRDRPGAVAVWGFVYLLVSAAGALTLDDSFARAPEAARAVAPAGDILSFLLTVILLTAVLRAVLHPERRRFFFLRLGLDELRMIALFLLLGGGGIVLFFLGFFAVGALVQPIGNYMFAAPPLIGLFLALFWLTVRLSLSFPLTVMRGRIVLGESWTLTRGRFWPLLGTYFLVLLLVSFLLSMVAALGLESIPGAFARYGPAGGMLSLVADSAVGAIGLAFWGGALAAAAGELAVDIDKIAETFA